MSYRGRKIANSFYLPKHPFLRGIASLMDFTGSLNDDTFEQILERSHREVAQSDADAMRSDWEAVGESMWWAINAYEKEIKEGNS